MRQPNLSIIIVSYNTRDLLRDCLRSLENQARHERGDDRHQTRTDAQEDERMGCQAEPTTPNDEHRMPNSDRAEIIVIDNASSDASAEMVRTEFPNVQLMANPDNRGFGAACNQGLKSASGRYALILNADIEATPGALERLIEFMDTHPEAAACGGKLLNPDGSLQPSCAGELTLWALFCEQTLLAKLGSRTKIFGGYWRTWWDFNSTQEVEQIMGACLLLRRDPTGSFPLFDEDYFLYGEDTDLCYRIRQAGGKLFYVHDALFKHHLGASGASARAEMIIYYNRGKERFFRKFHGKGAAFACRVLNGFGAFSRGLLWSGLTLLTLGQVDRFRHQARLFGRVLKAI